MKYFLRLDESCTIADSLISIAAKFYEALSQLFN